jgi:hypothetical protein
VKEFPAAFQPQGHYERRSQRRLKPSGFPQKFSWSGEDDSKPGRSGEGFAPLKLIRDRQTDRLVGARILAAEGSELLMEIGLAIKFGITLRDLTACFHPYLTLSEGVKLAALAFSKDVNKLSCCAS